MRGGTRRASGQTHHPALGDERVPITTDGPRPLRVILPVKRSLRPIKAALLSSKNLMMRRDSYHPAFLQHDTAIVLRLGGEREASVQALAQGTVSSALLG